jgi:hypothetical protein
MKHLPTIMSFLAALGAGSVALAQNSANHAASTTEQSAPVAQPNIIKIDRIEVRPDGLRVSVDMLYPEAGLLHLVGAENANAVASDGDIFMRQLVAPLFDGVEAALRNNGAGLDSVGESANSQTLGEWQPNQRVRLSTSRSRLSPTGVTLDAGMDCGEDLAQCEWAINNDQLLGLIGGLEQSLETYRLSAQWASVPGVELGLDYFDSGTLGRHSDTAPSLLADTQLSDSLARGVDVNLAFGGDVGSLGQLAVSLKFRKMLDSSLRELGALPERGRNLIVEESNDAALGVNWQRGDFSGGVVGRYYDDLAELSDSDARTWVTLDLQFTWETPWQGSFELGARNLLGGERPQDLTLDSQERFEHLFGRIPYLQYRQSL